MRELLRADNSVLIVYLIAMQSNLKRDQKFNKRLQIPGLLGTSCCFVLHHLRYLRVASGDKILVRLASPRHFSYRIHVSFARPPAVYFCLAVAPFRPSTYHFQWIDAS